MFRKHAKNDTPTPEKSGSVPADPTTKAATTIQRIYRGYLARKHYHYIELDEKEQTDYLLDIPGSDPEITGLSRYQVNEGQIALIGTSGIRSLLLACQLANKNNKALIPKVIIIDNSKHVYFFWNELRKFFSLPEINPDFFDKNFIHLMREKHFVITEFLIKDNNPEKDQIIMASKILKKMFADYGFDYVKSMIKNATFIRQSWADGNTICKLKNILSCLEIKNVFVYTSNIVSTKNAETARSVLNNIYTLNPTLSIQTNQCRVRKLSTRFYLFENKDIVPENIEARLYTDVDKTAFSGPYVYAAELNGIISCENAVQLVNLRNKMRREVLAALPPSPAIINRKKV